MVIKVNDMDLRILSLFTKGYNKDYYIREVEKKLNISSRTALVTLSKLEKNGILKSRVRGKIKTYIPINSIISKEFFILTEQYKKIQFFEENILIKEILQKSDDFLQGMIVVFGSYAKYKQNNDSDLDLFVVGKCDEDKVLEVGKKYGIEINIKKYPMKIFKHELFSDILLKEVVGNHILIKGTEKFIGGIFKWIK